MFVCECCVKCFVVYLDVVECEIVELLCVFVVVVGNVDDLCVFVCFVQDFLYDVVVCLWLVLVFFQLLVVDDVVDEVQVF